MSSPIPVAVVGATGYSGAELIRLLLQHPGVAITMATSRQLAGTSVGDAVPRLRGMPGSELPFTASDADAIATSGVRAAFLALPHGVSHEFAAPLLAAGIRVLDLSDDFRVSSTERYREYRGREHPAPDLLSQAVYGLPEIHGEAIRASRLVACPGCYPTSMLIPLIPVLRRALLDPASIVVHSMSGVSGAGRKAEIPLLFSECNESLRAYGAPFHRHLAEVEQELELAAGSKVRISFTPHLVPVTRGLATTICARRAGGWEGSDEPPDLGAVFAEAYGGAPCVRILGEGAFPDTKHVVGTPFVDIGWVMDARTDRVLLFSAEDNLGKGAAAQAVQCFNLMFDRPEGEGLLAV